MAISAQALLYFHVFASVCPCLPLALLLSAMACCRLTLDFRGTGRLASIEMEQGKMRETNKVKEVKRDGAAEDLRSSLSLGEPFFNGYKT